MLRIPLQSGQQQVTLYQYQAKTNHLSRVELPEVILLSYIRTFKMLRISLGCDNGSKTVAIEIKMNQAI
jgi:hypothetical protein